MTPGSLRLLGMEHEHEHYMSLVSPVCLIHSIISGLSLLKALSLYHICNVCELILVFGGKYTYV